VEAGHEKTLEIVKLVDNRFSSWSAEQFAIYFEQQLLPILSGARQRLDEFIEVKQAALSPKDLLPIVLQDPLLCLRVLRTAEQKKSQRLERETTTVLAALLQLGDKEFKELLLSSETVSEETPGLEKVIRRARIASRLAQTWSRGRGDINPEEVTVAALLGGLGDILLWIYAPEIPRRAEELFLSGEVPRSAKAQMMICGFTFKELTLLCAERWGLPTLINQLLRGSDSVRARITRVCSNTARHVLDKSESAVHALVNDMLEVCQLITNTSPERLFEALYMLPEERRQLVFDMTLSKLEKK